MNIIWSVAGICWIKSAIAETNVLAFKHSTVTLGCSNIFTPTWSKEGEVLHRTTGILENVTESDSGIYTCLETGTEVQVYVGGML